MDLEDLEHIVIIGLQFGSGKQITTKNKRSESRSSQPSKRPRNASKSKEDGRNRNAPANILNPL